MQAAAGAAAEVVAPGVRDLEADDCLAHRRLGKRCSCEVPVAGCECSYWTLLMRCPAGLSAEAGFGRSEAGLDRRRAGAGRRRAAGSLGTALAADGEDKGVAVDHSLVAAADSPHSLDRTL
jgi:hypothetical protein